MRPSSIRSSGAPAPTYGEERDKRLSGWESEVEDVLAKIKGSSLKEKDKILAIQRIDLLVSRYKLQICE